MEVVKGRRRGKRPTEPTVSLGGVSHRVLLPVRHLPNAEQLDAHVDAECLLERSGLLPAEVVLTRIHLVRKRHLLLVPAGEQADLRAM